MERFISKINLINNVSFIGAGRMAEAIITCLSHANSSMKVNLYASHYKKSVCEQLAAKLNVPVLNSNIEAINKSELIVLSVRPQQIEELLDEVSIHLNNKVVISLAVGVPLEWLKSKIPEAKTIFHFHPTTTIMAGIQGLSFISFTKPCVPAILNEVLKIFSPLGKMEIIDELDIQKYAVISGCAPAFIAKILTIWKLIAVQNNIEEPVAQEIIANIISTIFSHIKSNNNSLESLIDKIATPNGVTKSGLEIIDLGVQKQIFEEVIKNGFNKINSINHQLVSDEEFASLNF